MKFVQAVKELQQQVLDGELTGWKREQQLAGNGLQMTLSLETIQVQTALQLFNRGVGGGVSVSAFENSGWSGLAKGNQRDSDPTLGLSRWVLIGFKAVQFGQSFM